MADLALAMSPPGPVRVNQNLAYTINVTNNGPQAAIGVVVSDVLPAGVAFVSATASQGTATQSGGTVTANLGNLAAGASATVTLVVTPGAATPAEVAATQISTAATALLISSSCDRAEAR